MEQFKKIMTLENEIEASLMKKLLDEAGIPFVVKSYYDSSLDGLYQTQKGWGHIEAPAEYEEAIHKIYYGLIHTDD